MMDNLNIKLDDSTYAEQVFQHIKRMILEGDIKGGERIPEERIAQTFGVSRTPIREALRKLEKFGLVRIIPRSHAEVVSLDQANADDLWEVRTILEVLSVRRLASRATAEDVAALTAIADSCREAAQAGDTARLFETDNAFHLEIARHCGNQFVYDLLNRLSPLIQFHGTLGGLQAREILPDLSRHYEIIEAIERRDPGEAERRLIDHIREGEHRDQGRHGAATR